jgi:cardiolipin synthase
LIDAAARGVIVNIIITGKPDKKSAYIAAKYYADKLSTYGIKVMRTDNFFMHAKAYMFDDKLTIIGTSNLDYRSLFLHYESNLIIEDENFTEEMLQYFDEVVEKSFLLVDKSSE